MRMLAFAQSRFAVVPLAWAHLYRYECVCLVNLPKCEHDRLVVSHIQIAYIEPHRLWVGDVPCRPLGFGTEIKRQSD